MAVSIDTVYQKVLALANKEQRGYITPQEFNLFADQAQMEIFEQYFYDEEQFERRLGSDIVELLDQKIQIFEESYGAITHGFAIPDTTHQIKHVLLHDAVSERRTLVERVDTSEISRIKSGSLLNNLSSMPVYFVYNNKIYFHPSSTQEISLTSSPNGVFTYNLAIIRRPKFPNWTYLLANNKNALYNPNATDHQDFELHLSEESKLVVKILQFAGVSMKDYNLVQIAGQKEASTTQQEKQ
jgi:hypothetical protein